MPYLRFWHPSIYFFNEGIWFKKKKKKIQLDIVIWNETI